MKCPQSYSGILTRARPILASMGCPDARERAGPVFPVFPVLGKEETQAQRVRYWGRRKHRPSALGARAEPVSRPMVHAI